MKVTTSKRTKVHSQILCAHPSCHSPAPLHPMDSYPCPHCDKSFADRGALRKHYVHKRSCGEARQHLLDQFAAEAYRDVALNDRTASPKPNQVLSPRLLMTQQLTCMKTYSGRCSAPDTDHAAMDIEIERDQSASDEDTHAASGNDQPQMDVDDHGDLNQHRHHVPNDSPPEAPRFTRRQQHGFAMVEVHKTAARVIRWEFVDEPHEPSPADILKQREWFRLGEWLGSLPISDNQRAEYFEMERVSYSLGIILLCLLISCCSCSMWTAHPGGALKTFTNRSMQWSAGPIGWRTPSRLQPTKVVRRSQSSNGVPSQSFDTSSDLPA